MVFCVFLAGIGIVLNQFENIKKVMDVPNNLEVSRIFTGWADRALTGTIGESSTETLVVGLFWAIVGLAVYVFLRSLARIITDLDDDLDVSHYVWPKGANRYGPLKTFAEQTIFRLTAFVLLMLVFFGPLSAALHGPVLVDFLGPSKPLQYIVWFLAGFLVWHIITILLRLLVLKNRLFN